jgi:LysM repeat protein
MNKLNKIILLFGTIWIAQPALASPLDSLRMEQKNGQYIVLHKAEKGQSLYSLLRRYGSSMTEFKDLNPGQDINLQLGQVYKLAYNKPVYNKKGKLIPTSNQASEKASTAKAKFIKVEPGMTLYAVSRKTGVSVTTIKKLNFLTSDQIEVGQLLQYTEGAVDSPTTAQQAPPSLPAEKPKPAPTTERVVLDVPKKEPAEVKATEAPKVSKPIEKEVVNVPKPAEKETITIANKPDNSPKVAAPDINNDLPIAEKTEVEGITKTEEGIAEVIELESKSGKYLALHKTAPLGTLVQVRNETTGATVWVKIIGKLPELTQNENIVIKLSPKAMNRVSPVDKKFRAKVFYTL